MEKFERTLLWGLCFIQASGVGHVSVYCVTSHSCLMDCLIAYYHSLYQVMYCISKYYVTLYYTIQTDAKLYHFIFRNSASDVVVSYDANDRI